MRTLESTSYMEIRDEDEELNLQKSLNSPNHMQLPRLKNYVYKWRFQVFLYITFLLVGQSAATLLSRFYYDNGGHSKWIVTLVQSAGFPILIPFLFYFPRSTNSTKINTSSRTNDPPRNLSAFSLLLLFLTYGILITAGDLMYSYGLAYLPVSTYSLICATQLAFNAVFSFLLNSQKFTFLILNSLLLLTVSASLLAVHPDTDDSSDHSTTTTMPVTKVNYIIGFLCTLSASAMYSLGLSLVELSFKKLLKRETSFEAVLEVQVYPSFVATCGCVLGLFLSGEWRTLADEIENYEKGRVSYVMTLFWTAILWQISSLGLFGLISEVSSLFSNVISTIALPIVPILGAIFFHDKMDGVKVIALLLAIWGFLSYVYQHYLDDPNSRKSLPNGEASA